MKPIAVVAGLIALMGTSFAQAEMSEAEITALLKKSHCLKCHSVDKKKDGPPFKETAAAYRDNADGEQLVFDHITSSPMIEVDGFEEEHGAIKSDDEAEIRSVVRWILSR
jgi:cytochrome c